MFLEKYIIAYETTGIQISAHSYSKQYIQSYWSQSILQIHSGAWG